MAHGSFPMEGEVVVMTDAIAKRMGFINLAAMRSWESKRETSTLDKLLVDVCNLQRLCITIH